MKNRIINDIYSDYHMHSIFSDGTATIEEIVQYAGKLWMKEIAITEHSDFLIEKIKEDYGATPAWGARYSLNDWENIHNDVKVIFGVEWDVLNKEWDVFLESQRMRGEFTILALHWNGYQSKKETATLGLLNAIERHHKDIDMIGHPWDLNHFWECIDMKELVEVCNNYNIPMEFNMKTFIRGGDIRENLLYMLKNAKSIYVNSDAHNLSSLRRMRKDCYDFLKEQGIT